MKKLLLIPLVLAIAAAAFALSSGKINLPLQEPSRHKGVSLSPKNFQGQDFLNFFEESKLAGTAITWAGDWDHLGSGNSGPLTLVNEAPKRNLTPIIIVTAFTDKNNVLAPIRNITPSVRQGYIDSAVAFVKKHNIKYLGVGIEINRIYEGSSANFDTFVSLFNDTYVAVKAASPNIKVFTVWQLEKLKGLNGGLFGGKNDAAKNNWSLLSRLEKADFFAFTTYPGLIFATPAEIPADYYSEIKTKTAKPIAFTEIGWPSRTPAKGWDASEDEQDQFLIKFIGMVSPLDSQLTIWPFLYDQDLPEPFKSIGLLNSNGQPKKAYTTWKDAKF